MNNQTEKIIEQKPYRHFKGKLYFVHSVAEHSETGEKFVVYQALYPPYKMYVRPFEMFFEDIDINRQDNITKQTKRFELFDGEI